MHFHSNQSNKCENTQEYYCWHSIRIIKNRYKNGEYI